MGKCPFLKKSKKKGARCLSPDYPGEAIGELKNIKQETGPAAALDLCKKGGGKGCPYNFDENNRLKFGPEAPLFCERIWVNPVDCQLALIFKQNITNREVSGRVISDLWPPEAVKEIKPVRELDKMKFCLQRWHHNLSWQDTGAYELVKKAIERHGKYDRCSSLEEVEERYRQLDLVFETVKKEGRLKTGEEINPVKIREQSGIFVHLGPERELYLGGGGLHRFAIAYILNLPVMPAKVGLVHEKAIAYLDQLRNNQR